MAILRADVYRAFLSRIDDDTLNLPLDLAELLEDIIAFADPVLGDAPAGAWSATGRAWDPPSR